jgi:hypothetical protein
MEITLTLNGIERRFKGDYDTMHNVDWSEEVRDMLDSEYSREQQHGDIPGFEGTMEALDNIDIHGN